MATAELEKLRNIVILGQGGSGKTSLAEAMLFAAGVTTAAREGSRRDVRV